MTTFTSLLATAPASFVKDADIESPDEVQLENDFSNMAFSFLQDRAPKMIPYLLGFEVVDREEDGSKAIGIFGFKVGDDYYYVPAFFTNGQVRGIDLLFSKRTNSFVPLREAWIDYILNRQAISLGDTQTNANQLRQDFENPDFDFVAQPPIHKRGTDESVKVAVDGFEAWNTMQHIMVESMEKDGEFQEAFACAVARMKGAELPIEKKAATAFEHDGIRMSEALLKVIEGNPKFASALLTFYPSVMDCAKALPPVKAPAVKQAAQLEVVSESRSGMSDRERRRLVRDGFTVLDRRGPGQRSEVFDTDYIKTYANPDRSGTFNVLLRNGSIVKAWVLEAIQGLNGIVVVHPTRNVYFTAEPGAVLVEGDPDESAKTPYSAAGALNRVKPGKRYILVNDQGKASGPFKVKHVISENRRRTQVEVRWDDYVEHKQRHGYRTNEQSSLCCYPSQGDTPQYLQLAEHNGMLAQTGKHVVVPANWKALELGEKYLDYESSTSEQRDENRAAWDAFTPGDMTDLREVLEKTGIAEVMVENQDRGSDFHIHVNGFAEGPFSYKTATVRLTHKYGIGADVVEDMLKQALVSYKARHLVKFAQGVGGMVPMPPVQPMGYDDYSGLPIETPQVEELQGQSVGMPEVDYSLQGQRGLNIGGQSQQEMQADPNAMNTAMQAAQAGQKKVFDHAAIGGLSRMYDPSAVIDAYIPEMSKALDRVGRILFIFYWKNEEFAERYGNEDMGEMEDLIRGVFKSFGDLVLKLKQQSVDTEAPVSAG
jgi:hypothetical protein